MTSLGNNSTKLEFLPSVSEHKIPLSYFFANFGNVGKVGYTELIQSMALTRKVSIIGANLQNKCLTFIFQTGSTICSKLQLFVKTMKWQICPNIDAASSFKSDVK